jgi:Tfp pilus assembly protein PilO
VALDQKKTLLLIGAGTLLACGALGYLTYSAKEQIELRVREIEAENKKVTDARTKIAKIRGLEDDVIVLRQNVEEYVKILPDDRMVNDFLNSLSNTAAETGIRPQGYAPNRGESSKGAFEPISYQIRAEGTLWQLMAFLNRIESRRRFMIVPRISIKPGKGAPGGDIEDVVHEASLLVQTYRYNPKKTGSEPTKIQNEERRIQELQERIALNRKDIIPPTPYAFTGARNRRDPFIDPRIPVDTEQPFAARGIDEQREIFEQIHARVTEVEAAYERRLEATAMIERLDLHHRISAGIADVEKMIHDAEAENVFTYLPLRSKFNREVKLFEDLKLRFDKLKGEGELDFTLTLKELKVLLDHMQKLLQSGDLDAVIDRNAKVKDRLVATAKDPKRRPYVTEIQRLAAKAAVAKEFRGKKLDVSGVAIMPTGAAAIINGQAVSEGELLEDDLVVHLIQQDSIEFIYKNVVIVKKR